MLFMLLLKNILNSWLFFDVCSLFLNKLFCWTTFWKVQDGQENNGGISSCQNFIVLYALGRIDKATRRNWVLNGSRPKK